MKTPEQLYVDAIKKIILDIAPLLFRNDPIDWETTANLILKISDTHIHGS